MPYVASALHLGFIFHLNATCNLTKANIGFYGALRQLARQRVPHTPTGEKSFDILLESLMNR
uniref:Uncharacterized protein n=1 Tax=Arundo donax TaxID=35708 RepID=A0A0A9AUK1_ARUDO